MDSLTLKTEAVSSSAITVNIYQSILRHVPYGQNLQNLTSVLPVCVTSKTFRRIKTELTKSFYTSLPVRLLGDTGQLKCDGTRAETRFRLSAKRTSPFKSGGASVQSTTGSRGVHISGSNAGYTMFRGSVKSTGYPFHSPVSHSLPLPCVTVCHHISTAV